MLKDILDTYRCLISCRKNMPGMRLEDAFKSGNGSVQALEREYAWLQNQAASQGIKE
jgi:hypothetical protein